MLLEYTIAAAGCALLLKSLVFSIRWLFKKGVPPGPLNVRSQGWRCFFRFLLGCVCVVGVFPGRLHALWLVVACLLYFSTLVGAANLIYCQVTDKYEQFSDPPEAVRRLNIAKAALGVVIKLALLAGWITNWSFVLN